MKLDEWTLHYIDHFNTFKKNLVKKEVSGDHIICEYKEGKKTYHVTEKLRESDAEIIVTLNTKRNVEFLIDNWSSFLKEGVKIIFANPEINEQWSIIPFLHNKFCGEDIGQGLKALAENVPEA